jgi:hypothetical protein
VFKWGIQGSRLSWLKQKSLKENMAKGAMAMPQNRCPLKNPNLHVVMYYVQSVKGFYREGIHHSVNNFSDLSSMAVVSISLGEASHKILYVKEIKLV